MKRTIFLKGSLISCVFKVLASSTFLIPMKLLGAWNKEAFRAEKHGVSECRFG